MSAKFPVTKKVLEEAYWKLLQERYPLVWLWWHPEGTVSLLFPPWDEAAVLAERERWRRLAEETPPELDSEVQHWAHYARWTALRLDRAPPHRELAMALRYANGIFDALQVLDPEGTRYPRADVARQFLGWLDTLQGTFSSTPWHREWFRQEAARMAESLQGWAAGEVGDALTTSLSKLDSSDDPPPVPPFFAWVHSAHVDLEAWRADRRALQRQPLVTLTHSLTMQDVLAWPPDLPLGAEMVRRDELFGWWLGPGVDQRRLAYGARVGTGLGWGMLLAYWRHRAGLGDLTWVLTPPPILEGGVIALAGLFQSIGVDWPPVAAQWAELQRQRLDALANADCQIFAERREPEEVAVWLSRWTGLAWARQKVPWLMFHPGYYVLAKWSADYWFAMASDFEDHPLWTNGPILPYQLFVDPDGA